MTFDLCLRNFPAYRKYFEWLEILIEEVRGNIYTIMAGISLSLRKICVKKARNPLKGKCKEIRE